MAVNMERMRWQNVNITNSIAINIPSKILSYYTNDSIYRFKIKSKISRNFPSSFNELAARNSTILLRHGKIPLIIPVEWKLLISDDFVIVQDASKLALLLLGHPVNHTINRSYKLQKPLPVIVTYYTCEIKDGLLVTYKDIDHLDASLEKALYRVKKL